MERIRSYLRNRLEVTSEIIRSQSPQAAEAMLKTRVEVENEIPDDKIDKRLDEITGIILGHKALGFTELFPNLHERQYSLFFADTKKEILKFFIGRENRARTEGTKRYFTNEELLGLRRLLPTPTGSEETDEEYYSRKMAEGMVHGMFYQQPKKKPHFTHDEFKRLAGFFHHQNPYRLSDEVYTGGRAVLQQYAEKLHPSIFGSHA